jgi:hypothetical protein
MRQRFQKRAEAVRNRNMPPVAGLERKAFVKQAELDFQDFAMIADSTISLDGGILTVDLRMEICDAAIRGMAPLERETQVAMENISKSEHRTYDDIMEAQREKREALIEDEDRPSMLPTDGDKITPGMLDSKADLQALIDGAEMFRVVETIEPIDVNECPGLTLGVPAAPGRAGGFSLTHGYLV